jgi:hypothetical protein
MSDSMVVSVDADAMRIWGNDNIIRNNFIHDYVYNESPGADPHNDGLQAYYDTTLNAGWPVNNLLIEGNLIYNIGQLTAFGCNVAGFVENITIRNNIFAVTYAQGLLIYGCYHVNIYNNIFYKTRYSAIGAGYFKGLYPKYIDIKNNIFAGGCRPSSYDYDTITLPTISQDYNLYDSNPGWGAFVNAGTHEINGINITTYPLFIDPDNSNPYLKNFHYLPDQPIIDAGTPLTGFANDKDGNARPQGNNWDLGPYEYSPTAIGTTRLENKNLSSKAWNALPDPMTSEQMRNYLKIHGDCMLYDATGSRMNSETNQPGIFWLVNTGENAAHKILVVR